MRLNECGQNKIGSARTGPLLLSLNGALLKNETIKALWVKAHSIFNPEAHRTQAFKQARTDLYSTRTSFVTIASDAFICLHSVLVRSNLEYAIQASNLYLMKRFDYLERLERLATRPVKGWLFSLAH